MKVHGKLDAADRARLDEAVARVRAWQRRPVGPILMMAKDPHGAARQARRRQRQRDGVDLLFVLVKNMFRLIDWLIDHNHLAEEASDDHDAVACAISRNLEECVTRDGTNRS
jgi:hypothetical protein